MEIKCVSCGTVASPGDVFCLKCGKKLDSKPAPATNYVEPAKAFASGLPAWSIEPPAVVVRRKAKI